MEDWGGFLATSHLHSRLKWPNPLYFPQRRPHLDVPNPPITPIPPEHTQQAGLTDLHHLGVCSRSE